MPYYFCYLKDRFWCKCSSSLWIVGELKHILAEEMLFW